MTFGRMIRDECRRQGVSQYELAQRMAVQPTRVALITRSRSITEKTLRRCARALGMEVECKLVRRKK